MFVLSRKWSERRGTWVTYKTHWMVAPWTTACGLDVTDDWVPAKIPHSSHLVSGGACKKCCGRAAVSTEET